MITVCTTRPFADPEAPRVPGLYARSRSSEQRKVNAAYGRNLLRVLGGLPDDPVALAEARRELLWSLTTIAVKVAEFNSGWAGLLEENGLGEEARPLRLRAPRDVATVLELRGRHVEAQLVRRGGALKGGADWLRGKARDAAAAGSVAGAVSARALRWAADRV